MVLKTVLVVLLVNSLAACGGSSGAPSDPPVTPPSGNPPPEPEPTGMLVPIENADDFKVKVTANIERLSADDTARGALFEVMASTEGGDGGGDGGDSDGDATGGGAEFSGDESDASADAGAGTASVGYSTTYTLENNVDEYDVVKYNGEHIFIAPSRGMTCCFLFEDEVAVLDGGFDDGSSDDDGGASDDGGSADDQQSSAEEDAGTSEVRGIRVLKTDAQQGLANEIARLPVEESQSVEGLYLLEDRLVTLSSTAWWGRYGEAYSNPQQWQGDEVGIDVYDLSANFERTNTLRIEGVLVNSRRTSAGIFVVTRYTPQIEGVNYYPSTQEELAANENLLAAVEPADLLPKIALNGEELAVLDYENCYSVDPEAENAPMATGYPIVSIILQIDPNSAGVINASCLTEPVNGVYLTTDSLYFTAGLWEAGYAETIIHQFGIGERIQYAGSARLKGGLFLGNNQDYRLNASGSALRAIVSSWTDDVEDRIDHSLYVMSLAEDKPELEIVAQLPNEARSDEIGKPNEDLYGVRFLGDRAYLVTFEQIDPLYAIDLTDPTDPFIAGSLEIPGFSNFLHPISDAVLMGLGQIDGRVKLEFFDVLDISSPTSIGALVLDDSMAYSYSAAEWNRKAFTYWRKSPDAHRMTIPVSGYAFESWEPLERLYLFDIVNPDDPNQLTLTTPGYLSATSGDSMSVGGEPRAILHEDSVFWVLGQEVFSALWNNPQQTVRAQ